MKQTVGSFHHVVFGEARDLLPVVAASVFESVTNNLFRSRTRDQFQTLNNLPGLLVLDTGVKILFVLAHYHNVHYRVFSIDKRMIGDARPYIGIQAKDFPNSHIQAFETTALRSGDRCLKKDLCSS